MRPKRPIRALVQRRYSQASALYYRRQQRPGSDVPVSVGSGGKSIRTSKMAVGR